MIHAPNGMQLTELSETPKMKCNKRNLISDGGMKIPTLTHTTTQDDLEVKKYYFMQYVAKPVKLYMKLVM